MLQKVFNSAWNLWEDLDFNIISFVFDIQRTPYVLIETFDKRFLFFNQKLKLTYVFTFLSSSKE